MRAAVERFGRIDVLVNNAASFYAGHFEEARRLMLTTVMDTQARRAGASGT